MTSNTRKDMRNIAIIAHVDHGKTTLVDALLQHTGVISKSQADAVCVMDSNDLEKERGITIFSKVASFEHEGMHFNIVDTPGHADFGSEVERILGMVDGALLLVDAFEGPMPQTKFVLRKSFELGLKPIVVVNKIDRPDARPDAVVDLIFELFDDLDATEDQMDFAVVFASAKDGYAMHDHTDGNDDMAPLLEAMRDHVPAPHADVNEPLQMLITMLDYDPFVGRIAIGRILNGKIESGKTYAQIKGGEIISKERVVKILHFKGLERVEMGSAEAGDIVAVAGFKKAEVGATIAALLDPVALPSLRIDEPTVTMTFGPNSSPLSGQSGKLLTSRQIRDRLLHEASINVGLKVSVIANSERLKVSGRGELHLAILMETMRREGFEFEVSRPEVVYKTIDDKRHEPIEHLVIEVETAYQGPVMDELGKRKAILKHMEVSHSGHDVRLEFDSPTRALLGFRNNFLTMTRGTGIMNHVFDHYAEFKGEVPKRQAGTIVSMTGGRSVAYALFTLQDRGVLFIGSGEDLYEGMVIGASAKGYSMPVNATRAKKMTNVRASGTDEALKLEPPRRMGLEEALSFIEDDELVEVTPALIRVRKKILREAERRRFERSAK